MIDKPYKRIRDLRWGEFVLLAVAVAMAAIFAYWWWSHNAKYHAAVIKAQKESDYDKAHGNRPCPAGGIVRSTESVPERAERALGGNHD